tara:strand:- start:1022 stop:2122 length:1101 start_codon:yes stop_codon:yes gene_type:complete
MSYDISNLDNFSCSFDVKKLRSLVDRSASAVGVKRKVRKDVTYPCMNGSEMGVCKISKDILNVGPYQRNTDVKRIKNMTGDKFYEALAIVNVHEQYDTKTSKYYYTVVDGQHRALAHPGDKVVAVISNSVPEPIVYAISNDPRSKKSADSHDRFHADQYIEGSLAKRITKLFKDNFNIKIERNPYHGTRIRRVPDSEMIPWSGADYGPNLLRVYAKAEKAVKNIVHDSTKFEEEVDNAFISIMKTIFRVYPKDSFTLNQTTRNSTTHWDVLADVIIEHYSENIVDLDDVEINNFAEKLTDRPLFKKSSRAKRASHLLYDSETEEILPLHAWVDIADKEYADYKRKESFKCLLNRVIKHYDETNFSD